ncbi:MAG: hypothetical protein J5546_03535 [Lachnospiraceae bacterium]|nr:hypothetical protein [Lachnospiraceae bacterium]
MEENRKDQELEGKKLDDSQTGDAAGGYFDNDLNYRNPYILAQYGITYVHNFWSRDTYSVYGVSISETDAERIVYEGRRVGRALTQEEIRDLGIAGF